MLFINPKNTPYQKATGQLKVNKGIVDSVLYLFFDYCSKISFTSLYWLYGMNYDASSRHFGLRWRRQFDRCAWG